jgi:hypothetical protein
VKVTVRNTGRIPTALEQAKRVKIVRPDFLTIQSSGSPAARTTTRGAEFFIASRPNLGTKEVYQRKFNDARHSHHLAANDVVLFLEVRPGDASEFSEVLKERGVQIGGYRILRSTSPAIPNAIAGLLVDLRDRTYSVPHAYFGWTEGNPISYLLKFLAFGEGDTAPVCREVLRQAEPDPARRPRIHVG